MSVPYNINDALSGGGLKVLQLTGDNASSPIDHDNVVAGPCWVKKCVAFTNQAIQYHLYNATVTGAVGDALISVSASTFDTHTTTYPGKGRRFDTAVSVELEGAAAISSINRILVYYIED